MGNKAVEGGAEEEKWLRKERSRLIWPLFYVLFLHIVAFYFFTRGFLLTRTELSFVSNCSDAAAAPCQNSCLGPHMVPNEDVEFAGSLLVEKQNKCWTKPAVDRLVIIVLDALRFDFVAPSTFFEDKKLWMDKLKVLQKLASDKECSARIFKAIADPPTTSLQRLKGLTTGSLPTFIDVGNSFGAPSIIEDNLIYQLATNGKRVVMMGDDTWMQLFPNHFHSSHPFPSFNVKDLDTVDNGVIEHLFPALYSEDWDVLIAHFLGVDHAGHIFGVDSSPMIEKLKTYNQVLEKVVDILKNHSGPGELHENTFLIVLGDHGQTENGDHGGGTSEEVETSLFAMSAKKPPGTIPAALDNSRCGFDTEGKEVCISSIQQLDFAVTIAAMVGIPFPYGSIGQINPELYALSPGTWYAHTTSPSSKCSNVITWMQRYLYALCINSWQVKRYIDQYSASSILRFPSEDLIRLAESYSEAQSNWSHILHNECPLKVDPLGQNCDYVNILLGQINAYSKFLGDVAELARSKWTQFDIKLMSAGLCVLLASLLVQLFSIERARMSKPSVTQNSCFIRRSFCRYTVILLVIFCILGLVSLAASSLSHNSMATLMYAKREELFLYLFGGTVLFSAISFVLEHLKFVRYLRQAKIKWVSASALSSQDAIVAGNRGSGSINSLGISSRTILAALVLVIRACSLLSNSYILTEGKVAHFLLATTGILNLQYSIASESMKTEAFAFLFLNFVLRVIGEGGLSKQILTSLPSATLEVEWWDHFWLICTGILPMVLLVWVISLIFQPIGLNSNWKTLKCYFPAITILSYAPIIVYWALEGKLLPITFILKYVGKNIFPRLVYAFSFGMIIFLAYFQKCKQKSRYADDPEGLTVATVAMLVAWSSTILLLSGRQGPLIAILSIFEGWCIIKLQKLVRQQEHTNKKSCSCGSDVFAVTQWNLVAVSLFYCLGHWCTFDGLHYGAAFIGFDEFHLIRQGVLLAIETFGVSHILPILALPLLVLFQYSPEGAKEKRIFFNKLIQVLLIYGLLTAVTTTFTAICVTIQRRHLMVWGLFAPKYVFDVVGLILTDTFICLTALFYF
ncbi:uncharacterized protein LOC116256161 isoform X1 [Nymphaea colorata]|nr:uncharacterized protein LOC116256161 isoform X1 [Nymphaea colorata]XP_031488268.1 uncharacterized protein LOC116256161 isoform X1 [Nymphaea colorata]XP_031488269.1 uncharacterized protein LOC116256161 isoform X1 [Nymphaea colorata]XP_031488270.1 uncharacterized protein LOC116256161 isoform X1 [Nymphaea colorata]